MVTWCIAKMASVMRFSAQKGVILSLKSGRKCCKSERLDGFLVILCTKWSQMGVPRNWGTWSALSRHWFPMKNGRSSMMIDLDKWKHPSILIIVGYIYHYTFYIPIISTSLEKKKPCYLLYRPFLMLNQADHIPFFFSILVAPSVGFPWFLHGIPHRIYRAYRLCGLRPTPHSSPGGDQCRMGPGELCFWQGWDDGSR